VLPEVLPGAPPGARTSSERGWCLIERARLQALTEIVGVRQIAPRLLAWGARCAVERPPLRYARARRRAAAAGRGAP
jgi:hypothetical protein